MNKKEFNKRKKEIIENYKKCSNLSLRYKKLKENTIKKQFKSSKLSKIEKNKKLFKNNKSYLKRSLIIEEMRKIALISLNIIYKLKQNETNK